MSIEFVVFVVAVVLLIAYRNLGSGAISSAGGNVASGMKTALGWLAGTGRDVLVPDFASMVKIMLFCVFTAKTSGNAILGEPNLNAFQFSAELNLFTNVSSQ